MFSFFSKQKKEKNNHSDVEQGFIKRLESFFSTEPQKEKVLRHEDFHAAGDVYYAQISAGYKVIQRVIWLIFILFMIVSIVANYSAITYDNFYYLIKDFSSAASSQGSNYETLSYESDNRQKFTLYRGGVASVSPSKISVFTATGKRTLNATSSFSSPYIISSDRYMLVYDTAGKNFSLYNSFAKIHTETLEYPVYDACFGEDGSFAVATRTADSTSAIYIYDKSFKEPAKILSDTYVFDLSMNQAQNRLSVLSYELGDGTGQTVLTVRNLKDYEASHRLSFSGEFPLGCIMTEKNLLLLVTDRYVRVFDKNLEVITQSRDYSSESITAYSITEEGAAIATLHSSKNHVIAFDKSGNLVYNEVIHLNISDLCLWDHFLFLQNENGVTRIYCENGSMESLACGQGTMLIYNQHTALVCGESKAEYLIFKRE